MLLCYIEKRAVNLVHRSGRCRPYDNSYGNNTGPARQKRPCNLAMARVFVTRGRFNRCYATAKVAPPADHVRNRHNISCCNHSTLCPPTNYNGIIFADEILTDCSYSSRLPDHLHTIRGYCVWRLSKFPLNTSRQAFIYEVRRYCDGWVWQFVGSGFTVKPHLAN